MTDILDAIDRAVKTLDRFEPLFVSDAVFPDPAVEITTDTGPVVLGHPRWWARVVQACKAQRAALVEHDPGQGFAYHGVPLVELRSPAGAMAAGRIKAALMHKATGPARSTKPLDPSPTFL